MILIINTANIISDDRYVSPLVEILGEDSYVRHYLEIDEIPKNTRKIILSGNSIFSANLSVREIKSRFDWLETFEKPIFGICAGQQIIAQYFGSKLERNGMRGIKKFSVHTREKILQGVRDKFNGYVAHNFSVPCPEQFNILASANGNKARSEYLAKHKKRNIYVASFHPEFSEKQILLNFTRKL